MVSLLLAVIYIAFISLGLPDSLLGSAWPTIYQEFNVPISHAGIISMIISVGTVISSLQSDRMTHKLGTGKVTAISVATTAVALLGFSVTHSFWMLCVWAIPYGLGAGSVDASLNNYVALHYESRHMSWLHCFWGVGATLGPYIMGYVLTRGFSWNIGYRTIGLMQVALTAILILSLPLWKGRPSVNTKAKTENKTGNKTDEVLPLREVLRIAGVKEVIACFFFYSTVEQSTGLWASTYLTLHKGVAPDTAASFASMFFLGITAGRAMSGFLTMKFNDSQMIRLGFGIIAIGIIAMVLPIPSAMVHSLSLIGLILIGLGCAPIFPSLIHSTPEHFGADKSQAVIGVQMAGAYIGTCLMPPLFGSIAGAFTVALLPLYLLVALSVMILVYKRLEKKTRK